MENESIPNKLLDALAGHLQVSKSERDEWQKKLSELTQLFLTSEATVYCEDCGLVFYHGLAKPVACEKDYVDWKMLSFRHAWDTRHKVKVYLPFFVAQAAQLNYKNAAMYGFTKQALKGLKFDENMQVEYSLFVEELRSRLVNMGDPCARRCNDENWDARSTCFCSVCHKEFYSPKDACMCHSELKPWLPLDEVKGIVVKRFRP